MDLSHKLVLGFGSVYYLAGSAFLALKPPALGLLGIEGAPAEVLLLSGLFFGAYLLSNRLLASPRRESRTIEPAAAAYTSSILVLSGTAMLAALSVGLDNLMITRIDVRVPSRGLELINLHLAGSFLAAVLYGTRRESLGWFGCTIVGLAFVASFVIGVSEGRRTAVALPVLFLLASWWLGRGGTRGGYLFPILVLLLGGGGVVFTTLTRVDAPLDVILGALSLRVFNPAVMLSAVLERSVEFDPDTLMQIVRRLGSSFLGREYHSLTNDFGVAMGFLSASNYVVGINYGIVCEAFLWGGVWGVVFWAVALERLVEIVALAAGGPIMSGGIIIGLLAAHGAQMEIPYTVVVVIKAGLVILVGKWGVLLLSSFWRSLKVGRPSSILSPPFGPTALS